MPYNNVSDLPESVRDHLPAHAQEIYMKAFNSAWDGYKDPEDRLGDSSREETSHRVAWAAVKKTYVKDQASGRWKQKSKRAKSPA